MQQHITELEGRYRNMQQRITELEGWNRSAAQSTQHAILDDFRHTENGQQPNN